MRTKVRIIGIASLGVTAMVGTLAAPASASTSHTGPAQSRPAHDHRSSAIPFTTATVTANQSGSLTVHWQARGTHRVAVFAGASPQGPMSYVGSGPGSGSLTVTARNGVTREYFKLVPDHGGSLVVAARELGLASVPNFRDAGGYRTTSGQWVRMGVVYRSSALVPSPTDLPAVDQLGVRSDYDLRSTGEIAENPDVVPSGARYFHLDVIGNTAPGGGTTLPPLNSPEDAQQVMRDGEVSFVTSSSARQAYHDLLTNIAYRPGAGDYHCTAGKDRTGWASAVLLTLLGVPEQTIMQDYLLSNTYYYQSPQVQAELAALPAAQAEIYKHLLDVEPSYLQAGLDAVHQHYGSMTNYAIHGLGLTPATLRQLQAKLLMGAPTPRSSHQGTHRPAAA